MTIGAHPSISPDLAPCDFSVSAIDDRIPLTEHNFQDAFKKWQKRWEWCVCESDRGQ
jgi:hypothetical protein